MSDVPSAFQLNGQSQKLMDADTKCQEIRVDSFLIRARQFLEKLLDVLDKNKFKMENNSKTILV